MHYPSSSLSSDEDGVTSTTLDDDDGLQKTQNSDQPRPIDDAHALVVGENLKKNTEEEFVIFPGIKSYSLFFKRREVYDDKDGLQQTQVSEQSHPTADANTLDCGKNLKKPTEEKLVTFPESHSPFFNRREIYGNFMSPSMKERRFVCRFCCKIFAHFSTLQNYVRTHTGDKPF